MKQVYVIRHANWDLSNDKLTDEGTQKCLDIKNIIGDFDIVCSSNFGRTIETAKLLSGNIPAIEDRASILKMSDELNSKVAELRKTHPLGVVGALFSFPELQSALMEAGNNLFSLIKEIISKLPIGGVALIVSHDGTMISCEKIINDDTFSGADKTYGELEGFIIDEEFNITPWTSRFGRNF